MQQSITLIDTILSGRSNRNLLRDAMIALAATGLLTLSAKIQVPLIVPMTLQSLVVLLIGAAFGWRLGAATLALYLAEGAVGLPVFAGTPEKGLGLGYMAGPTGGFLVGMLFGALLTGILAERGWTRTVTGALSVMTVGHVVIFLFGSAWLAVLFGAEKAYSIGIAPFYAASLIKILLGAALLPAAWCLVGRLRKS
ncbi:BioY Uncharacterized conserved protein [Rhabdaerophilaceae bacterium]